MCVCEIAMPVVHCSEILAGEPLMKAARNYRLNFQAARILSYKFCTQPLIWSKLKCVMHERYKAWILP